MRNKKGIFATSLFAFVFWILFVLQDINIFKIDIQEVIVGLIVSVIILLLLELLKRLILHVHFL